MIAREDNRRRQHTDQGAVNTFGCGRAGMVQVSETVARWDGGECTQGGARRAVTAGNLRRKARSAAIGTAGKQDRRVSE